VLTFNLGGTDSDSNAIALGAGVIPASPDDRHRNRPPPYPAGAAFLGEQGSVVVLIHVSPAGLPDDVDVVQSSGHPLLDDAALRAVRTWRFVPAVKDGRAVESAVPMTFRFSLD
jgi:protein TonB